MASLQRCFAVVLCVLALTVLVPSTLVAITLPPAYTFDQGYCRAGPYSWDYQSVTLGTSLSYSCDDTATWYDSSTQEWHTSTATGSLVASLTPPMEADVSGYASDGGYYLGEAQVFYAFDVKQIAAPPTPVYSVPLTMHLTVDITSERPRCFTPST